MSIEHTAHRSDKGYFMIVPRLLFDHEREWHNASINFAMQNVAIVTTPMP